MNEAQTLLDIEHFMLKVSRRKYRWNDFQFDFDTLKIKAIAVHNPDCKYSPLVEAYFNLLPENISCEDQEIFESKSVFQCFQRELAEKQEIFLDGFIDQIRDNQRSLKKYFNELLDRHRKLLLVRVDLSYKVLSQPSICKFNRDIEKLVSRIQDKDTIFKDQVGYVYRLEQGGKSRGYHCHLLLIYNGSLRNRDSYLGQCIGELWKDKITGGCGQFYNCNQAEHKKYYWGLNQLGIGMIERRNSKEVGNALKAIGYLADPDKDDQYLRAPLKGMRKFSKGGSGRR
ncbi:MULTISPECIES: inovirus-type Gp2 protein [unclassified Acinetobacter]|uniref:YagK/YfjJ domain-containing protein n=1 Tax=unclassified Acinetobacter TaxID=196816 RepID=UPI0015D3954D|nr:MULTISPECIES: inovirus-type Gp2 protein [unclassified Acinetobacter]UUS60127.1 inovirus Gp2 family protein [Acinetobacter sp. YH16056_T]